MRLHYFCIFMYIWWLLKFFVVHFVESVPNRPALLRTFQLVSQQSLASITNTKSNILTKWPTVATNAPSGMNTIIGALVYWGIPSDLQSRPEQAHHLPGLCSFRWLQATYSFQRALRPQLYRKGTYFEYLWLYDQITAKKVIFDEIYSFGCGVYFSSDICRMRWVD